MLILSSCVLALRACPEHTTKVRQRTHPPNRFNGLFTQLTDFNPRVRAREWP